MSRLMTLATKYGFCVEAVEGVTRDEWRADVKQAVQRAAERYYAQSAIDWFPNYGYTGARPYIDHPQLRDLATIALHLRNDRLPTAP